MNVDGIGKAAKFLGYVYQGIIISIRWCSLELAHELHAMCDNT